MAEKRELRRRALSAVFLLAALGMLLAGETLLKARLGAEPVTFLIYWMGCFALVGLAFLMAVLELAVMRRRARAEQRELLESTLRQMAQAKAGKSPQNSVDKQ